MELRRRDLCSSRGKRLQQYTRVRIRVEICAFMDAFKDQGRLFLTSNQSTTTPTDANGWPTTDGIAVVFDNRPVPAPNCSGTMSFNGSANLYNIAPYPTLTFTNQTYDSTTNTTTVNVFLPGGPTYAEGAALMVIGFANTQRSGPSDPTPATESPISKSSGRGSHWRRARRKFSILHS